MKSSKYFLIYLIFLYASAGSGEPEHSAFEDNSVSFLKEEYFTRNKLPEDLNDLILKSRQDKYKDYSLSVRGYKIQNSNFTLLKRNPDARLIQVSFALNSKQISAGKKNVNESSQIRLLEHPDGRISRFNSFSAGKLFDNIHTEAEARELSLFVLSRQIVEGAGTSEYSSDCFLIPSRDLYEKIKKNLQEKYRSEIRFSKAEPQIGVKKIREGYRVDLLIYRHLAIINHSYVITENNVIGSREVRRLEMDFAKNYPVNSINAPANYYNSEIYKKITDFDRWMKESLKNKGIRISPGNLIFKEAGFSEESPDGKFDLLLIRDRDLKPLF